MDLKKQTTEQLKAIAYDQLAGIEQAQNNLKIINAEISERNKMEETKTEPTEEETPTPKEETA